ncbi:MAG: HD domain-containing protein [Armatimonadetes bacterium]|nr:HD domain-containing protein [Armatimonadota bacterium]
MMKLTLPEKLDFLYIAVAFLAVFFLFRINRLPLDLWEIAFFAVLASLGSLVPVSFGWGMTLSLGQVIQKASFFLVGTCGGVAVTLFSDYFEVALHSRKIVSRGVLASVAQYVLSFVPGAIVLANLSSADHSFLSLQNLAAFSAFGFLVESVGDILVWSYLLSKEGPGDFRGIVRRVTFSSPERILFVDLFLAVLFILVCKSQQALALPLLFVPFIVLHYAMKTTPAILEEIRKALASFAEALEARDAYTQLHSEMVTRLSVACAKRLGLPEYEIQEIERAASMHDIGKIAVPDAILLKPGRFTNEERLQIKQHATMSREFLKGIRRLRVIAQIAGAHHEMWDGTGYPDGLKGEEIPAGARIISVADVFHAMTSNRPYRTPLPPEEMLGKLRGMAGSHFDPKVVEAFIRVLEENPELAIEPVSDRGLDALHGTAAPT